MKFDLFDFENETGISDFEEGANEIGASDFE